MTNEEAIWRILDHQRIHSKKEPFTPKLDEAFSMAVEALKKEVMLLDKDEKKLLIIT